MRWFMKIFGQGLAVVIPFTLTVGLIIVLGVWLAGVFADPLKRFFPGLPSFYLSLISVATLVLLVFIIGLLMNLWLVRALFAWMEQKIMQLPLVKTVYGAIKDVMNFLSGGKGGMRGNKVVVVTMDNGWRQLGIVTRQEFDDLPTELRAGDTDLVAVYLPFSYQLGGFTYFIDKSRLEPVPGMSVEDAMRYSMMAWIGSSESAPGELQQQAIEQM